MTTPASWPTPCFAPKWAPVLVQGLIERWGIPLALYCDRLVVFKSSCKPRNIHPPVKANHCSRAMVELGIGQIFACSPQAKGRVDRMAGTLEDTDGRLLVRYLVAPSVGQLGVECDIGENPWFLARLRCGHD